MFVRTTVVLLAVPCVAGQSEPEQFGLGGPDVEQEFQADLQSVTYPFQKFPSSYVTKALSDGVDWTQDKRGVVTSVKGQGPHGYCGTFGRIGTAEGQYALHSGQPARNLSVEQLIDCVGWAKPQTATILGETGGLMAWEDYPYDTSKYPDSNPPISGHPCLFDQSKVVPNYAKGVTGMVTPSGQSEDQAAAFIHHNGPVSCGVNAGVFQSADADWFVTEAACKNFTKKGINHSTLCVGFGVDPVKGPYWKIKNSWGATWGDHGFIKVSRGVHCGGVGTAFGPVPIYGNIAGYFEASEVAV